MKVFESLKKANTVLIFILLLAALCLVGYVISKLGKPLATVKVDVESLHLGKKKK